MGTSDKAAQSQPSANPPVKKMDGEVILPTGMIAAAGLFLCVAMLFAFVARTTDFGATRFEHGAVARSVDLKFETLDDGSMAIQNLADGSVIKTLSAKQDGFIKIVVRDLTQERKIKELSGAPRARLTEQVDGLAVLTDLDTGRVITVGAFGPPNRKVFMELLDGAKSNPAVSENIAPSAGDQP